MENSASSVCLINSRLATSTKQTSYIFSFFLSFLPYCLTSSAGIPPLLGCRQTAAGEGSCPYYYFISVTLLPFATRLPVSACFHSMPITRKTSPSRWCEEAACLCMSVPAGGPLSLTLQLQQHGYFRVEYTQCDLLVVFLICIGINLLFWRSQTKFSPNSHLESFCPICTYLYFSFFSPLGSQVV